jgi:aldose 1-epimerase
MPAIVGWHPWFLRRLARGGPVEIDLRAGGMLRRGGDGLPTGEVVPVPPEPWDDAFVEVEQPVRVRWPGALELEIASDEAACWVVFTEPPDAVCVEPQTGPPNGLASGAYTLVEPGRPLLATMTIAWRRLEPS